MLVGRSDVSVVPVFPRGTAPAVPTEMPHTQTEDMILAAEDCTLCRGFGQIRNQVRTNTCSCVHRAVFRECTERYQSIQFEPRMSKVRYDFARGNQRVLFSRPNEEYCADFLLLARRVLPETEHMLFRLRYLANAPWQVVAEKLGYNAGRYWHEMYRMQARFGQALRDVRPFPLYPVQEYFGSRRPKDGHEEE